jgi:hypothetical protein
MDILFLSPYRLIPAANSIRNSVFSIELNSVDCLRQGGPIIGISRLFLRRTDVSNFNKKTDGYVASQHRPFLKPFRKWFGGVRGAENGNGAILIISRRNCGLWIEIEYSGNYSKMVSSAEILVGCRF